MNEFVFSGVCVCVLGSVAVVISLVVLFVTVVKGGNVDVNGLFSLFLPPSLVAKKKFTQCFFFVGFATYLL